MGPHNAGGAPGAGNRGKQFVRGESKVTAAQRSGNWSGVPARLEAVRARIRAAEQAAGREPGSVTLLAVSKTHPPEAIQAAHQAGQRAFGENYLQEALAKQAALAALDLEWHFIGPLQSNKTKAVAGDFDWVHSIDRLRIARRLAEQRPGDRGPLHCCIQVNVSGEDSKSGVDPEDLEELALAVAGLPGLRLRGLMAIPAPAPDFQAQRRPLAALRELYQGLRRGGLQLDTLSMGMTDDLEAAVAEGATIVRIGTAIFGPRQPAP